MQATTLHQLKPQLTKPHGTSCLVESQDSFQLPWDAFPWGKLQPCALFMFCSVISSGDTQHLLFVPLPCRIPLGVISSIISLALCTHLRFPTPLIFFFSVRR